MLVIILICHLLKKQTLYRLNCYAIIDLSLPFNNTSSHPLRMCIGRLELRSGNSYQISKVRLRITERR